MLKENNLCDRVGIAMSTFYNLNSKSDLCRVRLANETIKRATRASYSIEVVDDGSLKSVIERFKDNGAEVYPQILRGMGPGRREAIKYTYDLGKDFIVYVDPEKALFIPEVEKTVNPILSGNAEDDGDKR